MKTIYLEEAKNAVAKKHGFEDLDHLKRTNDYHGISTELLEDVINEVATELAKQCCDLQKEACSKSINEAMEYNRNKVLSTPNVVTTKS